MPTRDDVARAAKVSSATVSRAFNDPTAVDPAKVKRIRDAAQRLGYTPEKNASALRRRGTGAVMFLENESPPVQGVGRFYLRFYANILKAVKAAVDESMYQLVLRSFKRDDTMVDWRNDPPADAIVACDLTDEDVVKRLTSLGIPYVICRQMKPTLECNRCYIDEFAGGRRAGDAFATAGLSKPAHITGGLDRTPVCRERWRGFASTFADEPLLVNGKLGIRGGYESALKLVPEIRKGRFDSIFVVNDLTAIGVVQAICAKGLAIPKDVSIIGFDNLPYIDTLPIRLTTLDIGFGALYRTAVSLLFETKKTGCRIDHAMAPTLVLGDSVRNARRAQSPGDSVT